MITVVGEIAWCKCACGGYIVAEHYPSQSGVLRAVKQHRESELHWRWTQGDGFKAWVNTLK